MKYENPIIRGFNPDPSICRAGEDYYLVTSSFEYFPGIPVYHSTDLVNWELIGNAINRKEQLPMHTAKASGGIWAPTIRYNDGTFYITAAFDGLGNFIISSKNPSDNWSNPVWVDMDGIDPSMYFEDGKMYYCANDFGSRYKNNNEGISLAEVDANSGKLLSEPKRIWTGTGGGWLEAPHVYKKDGYYYLIAAEGGTSYNHMITAARSRNLWGPYESCPDNPIMTNRNDTSKKIACAGHGDIVDDINGNWWIVHLGTRPARGGSHIGRETFLMPVEWENDWIRIGNDKKSHIEVDAPILGEQKMHKGFSMDFSGDNIEKECIFVREPDMSSYIKKDGKLCIKPSAVKLADKTGSPSFIAVRQSDINCSIEAEFEFDAQRDGDCAGAAVYLSNEYFYRVCKKRINGKNYILVEKKADDFFQTAFISEIADGKIKIKINADIEKYSFLYSVENNEYVHMCDASTRFLACELAGKCFTGVVAGLFAEADEAGDADAEFIKFSVK